MRKQDEDHYVESWRQRSNTDFGEIQNNPSRSHLISKIKRYEKYQLFNNQQINDRLKLIKAYDKKEVQLKKLMNRVKVLEHVLARRDTTDLKD